MRALTLAASATSSAAGGSHLLLSGIALGQTFVIAAEADHDAAGDVVLAQRGDRIGLGGARRPPARIRNQHLATVIEQPLVPMRHAWAWCYKSLIESLIRSSNG